MTEGLITLMGAEGVEQAGHRMARAADIMKQAAGDMEAALYQQRQWMDDWLMRFQLILDRIDDIGEGNGSG